MVGNRHAGVRFIVVVKTHFLLPPDPDQKQRVPSPDDSLSLSSESTEIEVKKAHSRIKSDLHKCRGAAADSK